MAALPAIRGETRVSDKAIHSMVQGAAQEVPGVFDVKVTGAPRSYLAESSHTADDTPPADGADGSGGLRLVLDAGFAYPAPVLATAEALRSHVRDRLVRQLGEADVRLHLNIGELVPPASPRDTPRVQ